MFRESSADGALDLAIRRLERAAAQLEQRLAARPPGGDGLFGQDSAKLAAALEQAQARERQLEEAGAAASAALGRAIDEIKAALTEAPETEAAEAD